LASRKGKNENKKEEAKFYNESHDISSGSLSFGFSMSFQAIRLCVIENPKKTQAKPILPPGFEAVT
jgi:hypothetical protein